MKIAISAIWPNRSPLYGMRQVECCGEAQRLEEQETGRPIVNGGCGEKNFYLAISHGNTSILSGGSLEPWARHFAPQNGGGNSAGQVEYSQHAGPIDQVLAGAGVKFAKQVLQMPLDGFVTDANRLRNLLVRHVAGQQLQHFAFLWC